MFTSATELKYFKIPDLLYFSLIDSSRCGVCHEKLSKHFRDNTLFPDNLVCPRDQ